MQEGEMWTAMPLAVFCECEVRLGTTSKNLVEGHVKEFFSKWDVWRKVSLLSNLFFFDWKEQNLGGTGVQVCGETDLKRLDVRGATCRKVKSKNSNQIVSFFHVLFRYRIDKWKKRWNQAKMRVDFMKAMKAM